MDYSKTQQAVSELGEWQKDSCNYLHYLPNTNQWLYQRGAPEKQCKTLVCTKGEFLAMLNGLANKDSLKISDLLVMTRGNQSEVARMLRIQRGTLANYMKSKKEHMVIERDGEYHLFANISEQYNG